MNKKKAIAVLTSGGDAPGMNAAIRAVVRTALANDFDVYGIKDGFKGLYHNDFYVDTKQKLKALEKGLPFDDKMTSSSVSQIINSGGTVLGTARFENFRDPEVRQIAIKNLRKKGISALVVIGGNGSYQGGLLIAQEAPDIQVIGIPATIDNDIDWTMETIGFDTASKTISKICSNTRSTSQSHSRVCVIGAMGRHAGDLALRAGIVSGVEVLLMPEVPISDEKFHQMLDKKMSEGRNHALVMVAEGVASPEEIRKKVSSWGYDVRIADAGPAQRGGPPTPRDCELGTYMGNYAIKVILQGESSVAISYDGKNYSLVHFSKIFNEKDTKKRELLLEKYKTYQEITYGAEILND